MRHRYSNYGTVSTNPVNLFHHGNHVVAVLKHIVREYFRKFPIRKWPRSPVEVMNHVRVDRRQAIEVDRVRQQFPTASEIQQVGLSRYE